MRSLFLLDNLMLSLPSGGPSFHVGSPFVETSGTVFTEVMVPCSSRHILQVFWVKKLVGFGERSDGQFSSNRHIVRHGNRQKYI
jgi:hypothetical protein